jgi:hypothetical protein
MSRPRLSNEHAEDLLVLLACVEQWLAQEAPDATIVTDDRDTPELRLLPPTRWARLRLRALVTGHAP